MALSYQNYILHCMYELQHVIIIKHTKLNTEITRSWTSYYTHTICGMNTSTNIKLCYFTLLFGRCLYKYVRKKYKVMVPCCRQRNLYST
jgi:hypothetical protein